MDAGQSDAKGTSRSARTVSPREREKVRTHRADPVRHVGRVCQFAPDALHVPIAYHKGQIGPAASDVIEVQEARPTTRYESAQPALAFEQRQVSANFAIDAE